MLTCTECKTDYVFKLHSLGNDRWACKECYSAPVLQTASGLGEKVTLCKGIPGEMVMSRAEISEIKRNVAIPIGGGQFKCGRIGENGKVQERRIKFY